MGNPLEFMLDRTLMRPRDIISFSNEAITRASGSTRVAWDDIRIAETPYSEKRLLALRDEWKTTYPDIHKVFELFRGAENPIDRDRFAGLLDEAMLLPADAAFRGVRWMTAASETMLGSGIASDHRWADLYGPLAKILFDIGFIGIIDPKGAERFAHEDPSLLDVDSPIDRLVGVTVHPAFHAALDLRTLSAAQLTHPSSQ